MGVIIGQVGNKAIIVPLRAFFRHCSVLGQTGVGKSMWCIWMLLQFIFGVFTKADEATDEYPEEEEYPPGIDLIDLDNDTAEMLVEYLAEFEHLIAPERRDKILVMHPGADEGICLDPFDIAADAPDYDLQLAEAIEETTEIICRVHGMEDLREMRRMRRVTRVILYLCGTKGRDLEKA